MTGSVVYFSSETGNTHKFVSSLGLKSFRIPRSSRDPELVMAEPFVLITPTFAAADGRGAVPKQVIRFLNNEVNRGLIKGAIGGGNTNFGAFYAIGGRKVAEKCGVPLLCCFELSGTPSDVRLAKQRIEELWIKCK